MADLVIKFDDGTGTLVAAELVSDANNESGKALPTLDGTTHDALTALLSELTGKLDAGGEVALDAATLAALESITISSGTIDVDNHPADFPDATAQSTLASILSELGAKLEPGEEVALDAATLAALEAITANVDNFPADYPDSAAETLLTSILGQLDDATADTVLSVLKAISTELGTQQTDALTDTELRASAVPVSGPLTDTELRSADLSVKDVTARSTLASILAELADKVEPADLQTDALTDAELRASAVAVGDSTAQGKLDTLIAGQQSDALTDAELRASAVPTSNADVPDLTGTWGYVSGVSGTENIIGRVIGITAIAPSDGPASFTIDGGDSVVVPQSSSIAIEPKANLVDPEIVFTSTASYFVEVLT